MLEIAKWLLSRFKPTTHPIEEDRSTLSAWSRGQPLIKVLKYLESDVERDLDREVLDICDYQFVCDLISFKGTESAMHLLNLEIQIFGAELKLQNSTDSSYQSFKSKSSLCKSIQCHASCCPTS